ncbi:MAG: hypothetical protein H0X42_00365 [Solirubrobacterales bacterium]|nr:hypothetical protein [Solirubrobacterales bacterium]
MACGGIGLLQGLDVGRVEPEVDGGRVDVRVSKKLIPASSARRMIPRLAS